MVHSYFDECEVPVEEHRKVFMERLSLIDGRRATWTRMLDDGRSGHGLVPWVSNVDWWDQISYVSHLTDNTPDLSPAFVQWRAPTTDEAEHFSDVDFPFVVAEDEFIAAFSSDLDICHPLAFNTGNNYDYHPAETSQLRAIPLWAVTPIDEEFYHEWLRLSAEHWRSFPELEVIQYLYTDFESECTDDTGDCFNSPYHPNGYITYPDLLDNRDFCGRCALFQDHVERLRVTLTERAHFPNLPEPFPDVWKWGVHRYIDGWYTINEYLEEFSCPYSWASWLSPYLGTQHFGDLTIEKERASSIPSTSFQLSLESLIAG